MAVKDSHYSSRFDQDLFVLNLGRVIMLSILMCVNLAALLHTHTSAEYSLVMNTLSSNPEEFIGFSCVEVHNGHYILATVHLSQGHL